VLKYSTYLPAHDPFSKAEIEWMDQIEKKTNGAVKFERFFDGTLIGVKDSWEELLKGTTDVMHVGAVVSPGEKVMPILMKMGYAWIGVKDMRTNLRLVKQLFREFPELAAEWSAVKPLVDYVVPELNLHTKKAVRTLSDLKGMQIRGIGRWPKYTLEKLGASLVAMPLTEVYLALQKGIVDGILHEDSTLQTFRFAEVVKYTNPLQGVTTTFLDRVCININTWKKLPPNIQKVFEEMQPQIEERYIVLREEGVKKAREFAKEKKHEFISLPREDISKLHSLLREEAYEEAKKLDAGGLPGTKIFNRLQELIKEATK
jgi:TRAP-type C4-dicarboxylate transport system substrate-binding protein